jgi:hypothetical protein
VSLAISRDSIGSAHHRTMKATGMENNSEAKPLARIERHSYSEVDWISRQNLLALRSRENFFLDIPFYRTHRRGIRKRSPADAGLSVPNRFR